jgi:DNA-binding transcriptional ArsR family regulator
LTVDVFTALADPIRRDLLRRLRRGPARVVDLSADHDVSRPAISRHLRILGAAGLVSAEDRGRERHYRLEPLALTPVVELLADLAPRPPIDEHALDGLDLEIRRTGRDRRRTPRDNGPAAALNIHADTHADVDQQEDSA